MKKLLSVLPSTLQGGLRGGLLFLALLTTTALWAYDFKSGDLYYNITSDSTVEVTQGGCSGEVIIPETVTYNGNAYSVTSIGERAFYGCSLTSVTIPASVISLQEYSFYESKYIKTVYLKSTTPPILNGGKIFITSRPTCYIPCGTLDTYKASKWANLMKQFVEECEEEDSTNIITYTSSDGKVVQPYKTDVFGANIVSNEYKDGKGVITFDGPVTSIGDRAFYKCTSLTSITIPESVTSIGYDAFSYCSSLTSITIPESVTSIGGNAFSDCSSLTSITIPENVKSFGGLYNCSSLTTVVWNAIICDYSDDGYIFGNCPITSITFGENVKIIPNCICNGLNLLTSVTIPESVTSIGYNAFTGCSALTSVTIPESVTSIGGYAFYGCSSLTKTNYTGDIAGWCNIKFEDFYANPISYSHNLYINGQEIKDLVIPNTVNTIRNYAFSYCSSLTSITIPESITNIGKEAFYGCSSLTSATIGNSVTSIGYGAFYNCSSLTSIIIPNSVTSIGDEAFCNCKSLTLVTIPNSVTSIGNSAFAYCSALTKTNYTGDIAGWCDIKFGRSDSNPIFYSHNLYINDQEISDLVIPNTVDTIHNYAFYGCFSLTSITIPNSVTSIGNSAFRNCQSLTSITIPNSVTSIEDYVFADCSALTSITIPNSVTSIGARAFGGCSSLTSITCEAMTPPTLGNYTFYQVSTSIPVYVPCGCVSAYKAASAWKDFTKIQEPQAEYSIQVDTSNSQMGSAKVDYNTYCDGNQISATANNGYHFVQWSDGVTDNPRTLTLTQDTVLTAEFALTTAGQCGKNLYWVYDTNKSTLTITGSGDMYNERPWGLFVDDLTEVVLPEGLTHIGDDAFTNCNNLKAITIPASVTSIGANSFAGCRRIRDVYCYPLMPPYAEATSFANYNANLNVPCDFLEDYQYDPVFGSFKYFNCMGAESDNTDSDEVVVTPGTTDVTIVWPTEEDADTYSIVIYKDGRVFCTLTFNANGQLLNIAFAPGRDGNRPAQYAEQVANGYRFTVTGLTESTKYEYNITTKDESDNTISTHSGEFTTKSNTPTDLENNDIQYPISDTRKLLRDGQLYIYHNGSTYTIMGAEIK